MPKILCPINTADEVEALAEAGADELYCGVMSTEWRSRYSSLAASNKRENAASNLADFAELGRATEAAHAAGIPVYVAFNALYSREQYPLLMEEVRRAVDLGADALIVADLGLILTLREADLGVKVHVSTIGAAFNSDAVRFYGELGASRVILPRQLRIEEIARIATDCGVVELEAFALNEGCRNIDGLCTFLHVNREFVASGPGPDEGNAGPLDQAAVEGGSGPIDKVLPSRPCDTRYLVRPVPSVTRMPEEALARVSASVNDRSCAQPCGACRIAELARAGVTGIKIVGRSQPTAKKVRDIGFLATVRATIDQTEPGTPAHTGRIRALYKTTYDRSCGEDCYYPPG